MSIYNFRPFYNGISPNKFFDYISNCLPVLCNYPGWLAELIKRNECGMVVPPGDPEAFARALMWLADNWDLTRKMGKNSRFLAEREFDRNLLAERFGDWLIKHGENRTKENGGSGGAKGKRHS